MPLACDAESTESANGAPLRARPWLCPACRVHGGWRTLRAPGTEALSVPPSQLAGGDQIVPGRNVCWAGRQDAEGDRARGVYERGHHPGGEGRGRGGGGTDTLAPAPSPGLGARRVAQPEAGVPRGEKGPPAPGLRQAFRRLAWGQPAECGWQRCQCARSKTRVAGGTCPGHSSSVPTSGDPPISRRARLSTEGGRPGQRRLEGSQTCVFPAQCLGQLLNLPTAT